MEIIRGFITLGLLIFVIICIVLLIKRTRKTFYNMFNIHIVTATASVFCIGGGIGMLISLLTSDSFITNSTDANAMLIYACAGLFVFGVFLFVLNVYYGNKGLGSIVYAIINCFVQALIGFMCVLTFGIGFFIVIACSKRVLDDM